MILCHQRNQKYAALHNGDECACMGDKEFLVLQKLPTSSCNVRCVFNEEDFCGGKNAVSLFYAVGSSILSADENSEGITGERAICLLFNCYIVQSLETSVFLLFTVANLRFQLSC